MNQGHHKLSTYQCTAMITVSIIGVIILTLPRLATDQVGVDGGIATFAAGIIHLTLFVVMALLCQRFPRHTMIEFSHIILGRFLGKLYGILFTLYCILVSGVVLRTFADALKILLLQRTPLEFIMLSMLLTALLLVQNGISSISKISELFLPLIVLSILLLLALNIPDVELMHLRPSLSRGIEPYVRAIPRLFLVYLGYEVVYFLLPFMREPKKVMIAGIAGVSIPIFIYTMLVFTALTVFGVKPTSTMMYPTVILARRLLFPGAFAERFDIFFIIFWILAAFTTLGIFLYLSSIASTRLLGLRNYKPFSLLITPFVYQIAILPQNVNHIDQLAMAAGYTGAAVVGASVPLWIVAVLRKKGGKQRA